MSKLVAHVGKMKMGNLSGIEKHNKRLFKNHSNPAINTSKSYLNYDLVACPNSYKNAYQNEMNNHYNGRRKVRSDATVVDEWIFSASNDFFANLSKDEEKRFFIECLNFMENNFGHTIYATVHCDESTPHMHLGLVPLTQDGRLSHKDIFGRNTLKKLHTDLYEHLKSNGFDIEKPQPNDKKHLSVKDFKAKALDDKIAKNKQILQRQEQQYNDKRKQIDEYVKTKQNELKTNAQKEVDKINKYKADIFAEIDEREQAIKERESSYKKEVEDEYNERKKTLDAFYAKENDKLTQRESQVRYKEYSLGEREKKIDERDAEVERKERNFASKYNKAKEVVNHADEIEKRLDAKIALYKRLTSTKEDTAILTGLLTSIKQEYGQSVADALYDKAVNGVDATSYVDTQQLDDYKQFKRQTVKYKQVDDLEI